MPPTTAFHNYDPNKHNFTPHPKACERCYSKKVKCDLEFNGQPCTNCRNHGYNCQSRTRKRKSLAAQHAPRRTSLSSKASSPGPQSTTAPQRNLVEDASRKTEFDSGCTEGLPAQISEEISGTSTGLVAPLLFVKRRNNTNAVPDLAMTAASPMVDRFHNSSFLSRSAILGDDFPELDHSHDGRTVHEFELTETDMQILKIYRAFDLPALQVQQSLYEAFIKKCWTWMPVMDINISPDLLDPSDASILLLQATMLVGSLMRGKSCGMSDSQQKYHKVKALINAGYERNPLKVLAALCLIQWWAPSAPKDISTDTPRFWGTYAIGLAQQSGLYREPDQNDDDHGLRRRIWWTLFARDSLMAAAHGRPRIINPADCTVKPPSIDDFPDSSDRRCQIFVSYVAITSIICDLCQLLTRRKDASLDQKNQIWARLSDFVNLLPNSLRIHDQGGSPRPFDFELAQLHIPLLTTIIILYRPQSIFYTTAANAPAIAAANLSFRIFEAIELRDQTCFLSSAFSWYLMVAAIPQLSCLRMPKLRKSAQSALDVIENVLSTLGTVRPSGVTNLRNIQSIRKAIDRFEEIPVSQPRTPENFFTLSASKILSIYGPDALQNYDELATVLNRASINDQTSLLPMLNDQTIPSQASTSDTVMSVYRDEMTGHDESSLDITFPLMFGDDSEDNSWMRDWVDELVHD